MTDHDIESLFGLKKYVVYYSKKIHKQACDSMIQLIGENTSDIHLECIDSYSQQEISKRPYLKYIPVVVDNLPNVGKPHDCYHGEKARQVIENFLKGFETNFSAPLACSRGIRNMTCLDDPNFSSIFSDSAPDCGIVQKKSCFKFQPSEKVQCGQYANFNQASNNTGQGHAEYRDQRTNVPYKSVSSQEGIVKKSGPHPSQNVVPQHPKFYPSQVPVYGPSSSRHGFQKK